MPGLASDAVELECAVDALPEIVVADGDDAAKAFPAPVVLAPLGEATFDASADVTASGDEGHAGGAVQGFEASDDRE